MIFYIVPTMIALRITDIIAYEEFISGKRPEILVDLFGSVFIGRHLMGTLLNTDESYTDCQGKKTVRAEDKLTDLYNAIFVNDYSFKRECTVGDCTFTNSPRDFLNRVVSMLSIYADYVK